MLLQQNSAQRLHVLVLLRQRSAYTCGCFFFRRSWGPVQFRAFQGLIWGYCSYNDAIPGLTTAALLPLNMVISALGSFGIVRRSLYGSLATASWCMVLPGRTGRTLPLRFWASACKYPRLCVCISSILLQEVGFTQFHFTTINLM